MAVAYFLNSVSALSGEALKFVDEWTQNAWNNSIRNNLLTNGPNTHGIIA
jgi:hypothetical protein